MSSTPETAECVIARCLGLYSSNEYFVRRPVQSGPEIDYWNRKKDPDGFERDLEAERAERRADVAYIADAVNSLPPGRVLDIGCGLGELLEQIEDKHQLHGLDPSTRSIEICRQHTGAELHLGVLENLVGRQAEFDAIIAHHVIEHVDEPVDFVSAIWSMLAADGLFICGTPDFASAAARRFGDRFRLLHDPTHVSLFTEDSLIRLLRDTGFVIERVEKPYFETRFDSVEAYQRMQKPSHGISPPFYGSFITVFARKVGPED